MLVVSDAVAEEGMNLQFVSEVLHLDLPWSTSRIEQRIGRFDRFAAGGVSDPVRSVVVADVAPLDRLTGAWLSLLDDAFLVFSESSATLQYVLSDREDHALRLVRDKRALAHSVETIDEVRSELGELRRSIEGQDLLDEIDDSDDPRRYFEQLITVDRKHATFEAAAQGWIGKALNLGGGKRDDALHFGVNKRNPPLITTSDVQSLGYEAFTRGYTANRKKAGTRGRALLRPGQAIVDGAHRLCEVGSRGMAFAGVLEHTQISTWDPVPPVLLLRRIGRAGVRHGTSRRRGDRAPTGCARMAAPRARGCTDLAHARPR